MSRLLMALSVLLCLVNVAWSQGQTQERYYYCLILGHIIETQVSTGNLLFNTPIDGLTPEEIRGARRVMRKIARRVHQFPEISAEVHGMLAKDDCLAWEEKLKRRK